MGRIFSVLVFQCCMIAALGKSIKIQFDFEDMVKLLPLFGNSENLKQIISSVSRSANVRAELSTNGKYNNPYHPEDDIVSSFEAELANKTATLDYEGNRTDINVINSKLIRELAQEKVIKDQQSILDSAMEKNNDIFINDEQSISGDELTELVNDVNELSHSVKNIAGASGANLKQFENIEGKEVVTQTTPIYGNKNQDDRLGYTFLQRRFIKKDSKHTNITTPKEKKIDSSFANENEPFERVATTMKQTKRSSVSLSDVLNTENIPDRNWEIALPFLKANILDKVSPNNFNYSNMEILGSKNDNFEILKDRKNARHEHENKFSQPAPEKIFSQKITDFTIPMIPALGF